ncbi:MAG TPA: class I SAM-dependent methyltransferase [Candidatus Acidoferrales bacterium]|nr:class I SAM-dependent methyltransferase [Candidatus Acidoferrales bacterium]
MTIHPKLVSRSCYHKYEVEPGLFTPGNHVEVEPKRCLDELGVPTDLSGLRALDIGAWDGPYTFELERRGAQVTALDIQDPDITVFNAVKEIKNSGATYVRAGVYNALPETMGTFDLVLFAGVYYHLKNPVLALQRIRRLLADTGTLFIEGASATDYLAGELNKALGLPKSRVRSTAEILDQLPLSYFDAEKRIYWHWSNWWFPTTRCLAAILEDSGFRSVDLKLRENAFYNYSHRRLMGRAEADPAKSNPERQQYEHGVVTKDVIAQNRPLPRRSRLLSWLPPRLHPAAKWMRRFARRLVG